MAPQGRAPPPPTSAVVPIDSVSDMEADGRGAYGRFERARTAIMVGGVVRSARRRAGVSQAELARRTRTSQPSIARLEKGQVAPTVLILDRIARALGAELVIDFEPVAVATEHDATTEPTTA